MENLIQEGNLDSGEFLGFDNLKPIQLFTRRVSRQS
jgi:hypothetical protein